MGLSEEVLQGLNIEPVQDEFRDDTETLRARAEGKGMRMNRVGILVPIGMVSAQVHF